MHDERENVWRRYVTLRMARGHPRIVLQDVWQIRSNCRVRMVRWSVGAFLVVGYIGPLSDVGEGLRDHHKITTFLGTAK